MEIKINKEIRDFNESIFFGLSMRQFIFSSLAVIVKPKFAIWHIIYLVRRKNENLEKT